MSVFRRPQKPRPQRRGLRTRAHHPLHPAPPNACCRRCSDALKTAIDPNVPAPISTRQLKNLQVEGDDVSFDVELGYPAKSQIPALPHGADRGGQGLAGRRQRRQRHQQDRRALGAARRAVAAQGQEHHRRGLRQGRRRQEHDGGQPGAGAGGRGRRGRPARCRHLRPEPADDDGHRGPARVGRRQDHGADGKLRRAGDVDRLPGRTRTRPWSGAARW